MKMQAIACVARSSQEIADAHRVRNEVFVKEKELLQNGSTSEEQERDVYDDLDTTLHFIAYMEDVPVEIGRAHV